MIFNHIKQLKQDGKKIGITFSTFDMLHAGHIAMLSEAKNHCDYLICGLQTDPTIDRPETSVVYSALVGSVLMSLLVPFHWKTPDSLKDVLLLCSLGALGALGHYCVAKAMTYAPANFVSPFNYWQMVGSVFVGYWLFNDIPDTFIWLGSFLIIAAGVYVSLKAEKQS